MSSNNQDKAICPALAELEKLYNELAAEISALGLLCAGCGKCCHFETAGHILYASQLEQLYFAQAAKRKTNGENTTRLLKQGLRCPCQQNKRCLARDERVLGCRLHFCQLTAEKEEKLAEISENYHNRLKSIHEKYRLDWQYQPLLPDKTG